MIMDIGPAANARNFPDRTAVVFKDVRYTWAQWNRRINRLANALLRMGLSPGDKCAMMLNNCHQFLEVMLASSKIGVLAVPMSYRLRAREIEYVLANADAQAFVFEPHFLSEVQAALESLGQFPKERLITIGESEKGGGLPYEALLADSPEGEPRGDGGQTLNAMIYTSGTTGNPKGVYRTNGVDPSIVMGIIQAFSLMPGEVHLVPAPLYHSAPTLGSVLAIALGGTVVIMPRFEPIEFLEAIERERVTSAMVVPTIVKRILALPEEVRARFDISSMRALIVGAAPFPVETKRAAVAYFRDCVYEYYGSTDAGLNTVLKPSEQLERPASCGKALPGQDIKIFDDDGNELPPGVEGNVYIASPLVAATQYYKDPEKTKRSRIGDYMTVGDVGYLDKDGYLYICDRKSDMVISGGVNIYPAEIEQVIHEHPAVLDVAVIGVPSEEWGEELKAVLQLKPQARASEEEIIDFCRQRLADFKRPRSVDFVPEVPRNPSGKLLKRKLRERYWAGKERRV